VGLFKLTYRYSDELKRDVADGDVDSVENRKGSQDQVLSLSKTRGDLMVSGIQDSGGRPTKAPLSSAT
jgi:hypothetical protein